MRMALATVLLLLAGCADRSIPDQADPLAPDPTQADPSPERGSVPATGATEPWEAAPPPADEGRRLVLDLEGKAGEWVALHYPFADKRNSLGYTFEATASASGEGAFTSTLPQFVLEAGGKRGFLAVDRGLMLPADGGMVNQTVSRNVDRLSFSGDVEGLFLVVGGSSAWRWAQELELSGPHLVAGRMLRGHGVQLLEAPLEPARDPLPATADGTFSFDHEVGPGWSFVHFLRKPLSEGHAQVVLRTIDYSLAFPGNATWGCDDGHAEGVWVPPGWGHMSQYCTNKEVGTWSGPPGRLQGEGRMGGLDRSVRIMAGHVPIDLEALGLVGVEPFYAAF